MKKLIGSGMVAIIAIIALTFIFFGANIAAIVAIIFALIISVAIIATSETIIKINPSLDG